MEIIIIDNDIIPNVKEIKVVKKYICDICRVLKYNKDKIKKIIFADSENYGKEIKKINPNEDYTNNGIDLGVGKTMFIKEIRKNVIILNSLIFYKINNIINNNMIDDESSKTVLFIISHEIGHCIKNSIRYIDLCHINYNLKIPSEISKYYFLFTLDEFFANRCTRILFNCEFALKHLISSIENKLLPRLINLLPFIDNGTQFTKNIWDLFKNFLDATFFLLDYDLNEYKNGIDALHIPFDYILFLENFKKYEMKIINDKTLFVFLNNIALGLYDKFYTRNEPYFYDRK